MSEDVTDSIGEKLRSRREELGYSLKDAAERTRIRKSYIESLESDDFSNLPGKAYVTGFIKVYAGYLGLDPEPLMALLEDKSAESASVTPAHEKSIQATTSTTVEHSSSGWAAFFIGFIVVLIMGGGLYFLLASDDAKTLPEEPPVVGQDKTLTEEKAEPVAETSPMIEDDQREAGSEAKPSDVSEVNEESVKIEPPLATIKKTGSSLRMLAVGKGSLIINVDQRKPLKYVLHDGLDLTWKVKEKVFFEMAEAGQARFWLDGVEIKLDGLEKLQINKAP